MEAYPFQSAPVAEPLGNSMRAGLDSARSPSRHESAAVPGGAAARLPYEIRASPGWS